MADENIDWFALVIKKAWEDMPRPAQTKKYRALETLLHYRRQQLIRMAASRGATLEVDNGYEWYAHRPSPRSTKIQSFRVTVLPHYLYGREEGILTTTSSETSL
jgi:hypothetical protein